ncbi:sigma-70 family RNA polymerase sigma factor [Pseudonocardia sp.]|uniref:sigma-70 family RNA polymerase sigma factor n=1 Tax=Pseudonocardia sp. TaxID=60912 RepID=UPI002DB0CF7F|nr:sigma-70 family RNA polymerase sigma factor [Pseudonocardia sp.]
MNIVDDPAAAPSFESFVLANGAELVAFARRLTMDHHRAEDIVQDVLARIGLSWSRMATVDDVRAYVFKAILNDFLSWRRRLSSAERPTADLTALRTGYTTGVEDAVLDRDELQEALALLSPVQRAVLVLRYYHDQPDARIAALLGCREGTVRSHARRALTTLRSSQPHRTSEGTRR